MIAALNFCSNRRLHAGVVRCLAIVGIALTIWPLAADALSLGRSRGAALLGRPLDVTVLATLEPQESTPEATCFTPEVFYGDTQVGARNVSVTPTRTSSTELSLRVRSTTTVDEPFVTVYLRSTCGANVSRRYVLLSDSPSEPAPALQNSEIAQAAPPPAAVVSRAEQQPSSNQARPIIIESADSEAQAAARAERAARRRAAVIAQQRQAAKEAAKMQETEASTSPLLPRAEAQRKANARSAMSPELGSSKNSASSGRLKLDLLDASSSRSPSLRSSAELLSQPSTDPQARAVAAALWKAINASPEDLLRDTERLKILETEVRAMSELTKRQTKELLTTKTDLVQAQRERYANPFVYVLGALALGALGFAAWVWQRSRSLSTPWWGSAQSSKDTGLSSERKKAQPSHINSQQISAAQEADRERELGFVAASQLVTPPSAIMPLSASSAAPLSGFRTSAQRDLDINSRHSPSGNMPLMAERRAGPSSRFGGDTPSGFGTIAAAGMRPVNAEELFDIQQQADFFMSLGQHTQAIDILQNHISENVETSALAYLDLFDIYHKVNLHDDFAALRDEFNRVFNAQVPEFEQYGRNSRGLEDYAPAIERIMVLWPNAKVLEVIEESIFRKPDRDNQPFDLLAYRELMLLYAIAKDVCESEGSEGLSDNMHVDFDMSQPPPDVSFSLDEDNAAASAPAASRGRFSATEVQPLSATVPPLGFNSALASEPLDDWEDALKQLPLVSKHIGVDIELDIFGEAPAAPKVATKPTPSAAKQDNSIDFDSATSRDFKPSRSGKL